MAGVYDRFTINWQGEKEVQEAEHIRKLLSQRSLKINGVSKLLWRAWVKEQEEKQK